MYFQTALRTASTITTNNNLVYAYLRCTRTRIRPSSFGLSGKPNETYSFLSKQDLRLTWSWTNHFLYIHVFLVHLSSRRTVWAIQKKARLHKRVHIPWWLPSFFGPCNVCHDHIIKVQVRFTSIDWCLIGYFMVMDGSPSIKPYLILLRPGYSIEHVENIGPNYYTTLMHWRDNFMANKE